MRNAILTLLFACALLVAHSASAAVLVDDKFIDGGFSDGTDAKDLNWQLYTTGPTLSIVSNNVTGPDEGANDNALNLNNAGQGFRGIYGTTTNTALGVGNSLTLSYDFKLASAPGNTAAIVRFGLYNSGGTNPATDDKGYFARLSSGTGTPTVEAWKETGTDVVLSGADTSVIAGGSGSGFVAISASSVNLTLILTRVTLTSIKIDILENSTPIWSVTDSSSIFSSFDTIALGTGTNTIQFTYDNISLVSVVPEPSSIGFASLALGGCLVRRRRLPK